VLFFRKDWAKLIKCGYEQVKYKKKTVYGRLFWFITISTIPTAILCLVFDWLSDKLIVGLSNMFSLQVQTEQMLLIAVALIVAALISPLK
jgi:undecaprenyl pyrophosphate phosphatase UppP